MTNTAPRLLPTVLSACACLALSVGACVRDEPATYTPRSGTWDVTDASVLNDSCPANVMLPPPTTSVYIDYDEGDSFQIELGAQDVTCEIDGVEFNCGAYEVGNFDVDGFDATVRTTIDWDGELSSDILAEGNELTSVTCIGEDCNLLPELPCSRDVSFRVEFAS